MICPILSKVVVVSGKKLSEGKATILNKVDCLGEECGFHMSKGCAVKVLAEAPWTDELGN